MLKSNVLSSGTALRTVAALLALNVAGVAHAQVVPATPPASGDPTPGQTPTQIPGATSQENASGSDIVVTARRTAESAQNVPIALTVLSGEALQRRGVTDAQSLQGQIPSLAIGSYAQTREVQAFVLRGLGQGFGGSPSVVTYVNDVPMIALKQRTIQGPPGLFFDLQNVQVLNGPQGTLFGRNTIGGAVLLTPALPTKDMEGYVQVGIGNYREREIQAVINIPVSDTLAVRFAGQRQTRDGFTRDIVLGTRYDNKDLEFVRASALWQPSANFQNLTVGYYSGSRSNGTGSVLERINAPLMNGFFASAGGCAGVGLGANCSVLTDIATAQNKRGPREISLAAGALADTRIIGWGVTNQSTFDFNDHVSIRNIASVSALRARSYFDNDGTIYPLNGGPNRRSSAWPDAYIQYTEELQLQGKLVQDKIKYTVGVYYEKSDTDGKNLSESVNFLSPLERYILIDSSRTTIGVYGQTDIDFGAFSESLDGLRFTGGLRYSSDKFDGTGTPYRALSPTAPVASCSNGVNPAPTKPSDCSYSASLDKGALTWTAGLDYRFVPDVMAYAKVSRGFKAGGLNPASVNLSTAAYNPEFVITYEAGVKTSFHTRGIRGTFNVAAYSNDFKDIQKAGGDLNPVTGAIGSAIFNAAKANIRGVEADLSLRSGAFSLQANYSHTASKYEDFKFVATSAQIDCSGTAKTGLIDLTCAPVEGVAKDQFSVTGGYSAQLADGGEMRFSATYAYSGPRYVSGITLPAYEPGSRIGGYGLLNLSIDWKSVLGSRVDARAYMTNATNRTYRLGNTNVFNSIGYQTSVYGEPRMYGLQLRFNY